jgi:peroxidase
MHPWLASMYSLWVREHNRVARALAARNGGWSSERLFHEARRLVVAEMQHVTYAHWLPALTGNYPPTPALSTY